MAAVVAVARWPGGGGGGFFFAVGLVYQGCIAVYNFLLLFFDMRRGRRERS